MANYYSFLGVKIFAIVYFSILYFIIGFISSLTLNRLIRGDKKNEENPNNDFKNNDNTSLPQLLLEVITIFSIVSLIFYFLRKIIKNIPFPLEGVAGFTTKRLKELNGVALLAPIFMAFQVKFVDKLSKIKTILKL